jgi:hypothetical protein
VRNKITTTTEIVEFVSLWTRIQDVHLLPGVSDTITWKWTPDGVFVRFYGAYRAHFLGSFRHLKVDLIWRARMEPKYKIFAWILLQNKILITENLAARGWPLTNRRAPFALPRWKQDPTYVCTALLPKRFGIRCWRRKTLLPPSRLQPFPQHCILVEVCVCLIPKEL